MSIAKSAPPLCSMPNTHKKSRYYILALLTLVYCFNYIDRQILAILQEGIKHDLQLSDSQLGLLSGVGFAIFYAIAGIPLARWADKSNRRNLISWSVLAWSVLTALMGTVQNFTQLLLMRIGVGIGEAGSNPPSQSIISDLFPPEKRATAMSIFSSGIYIGILFAFLLGGWINQFFGWRIAFVVVGAPGILLAIAVRFYLTEPARGLAEARHDSGESIPLASVVTVLWRSHTFRHLALGASLAAFASHAAAAWLPSYFIRIHGMSTGELGTWFALIGGVGGATGLIAGGIASDYLAARDQRWYLWLPVIARLLALPLGVSVYLASNAYAALALNVIPAMVGSICLGSCIAITHGLVGLRMRATASAILFFIMNIIGLGCGPLTVGVISDLLTATHGQDALRLAMLCVVPSAGLWSAVHFYLASKHLRPELAMAQAPESASNSASLPKGPTTSVV